MANDTEETQTYLMTADELGLTCRHHVESITLWERFLRGLDGNSVALMWLDPYGKYEESHPHVLRGINMVINSMSVYIPRHVDTYGFVSNCYDINGCDKYDVRGNYSLVCDWQQIVKILYENKRGEIAIRDKDGVVHSGFKTAQEVVEAFCKASGLEIPHAETAQEGSEASDKAGAPAEVEKPVEAQETPKETKPETIWRKIAVNAQNIETETSAGVIIACPHKSEFDGFKFWVSKKLLRDGSNNWEYYLSVCDDMKFKLIKNGSCKTTRFKVIATAEVSAERIIDAFGGEVEGMRYQRTEPVDFDRETIIRHKPEPLEPIHAEADPSLTR